jgi:hypothetical protein
MAKAIRVILVLLAVAISGFGITAAHAQSAASAAQSRVITKGKVPPAAVTPPTPAAVTPPNQSLRVCYQLDANDKVTQTIACDQANASSARYHCVQIHCPQAISNGGKNGCWRCGK